MTNYLHKNFDIQYTIKAHFLESLKDYFHIIKEYPNPKLFEIQQELYPYARISIKKPNFVNNSKKYFNQLKDPNKLKLFFPDIGLNYGNGIFLNVTPVMSGIMDWFNNDIKWRLACYIQLIVNGRPFIFYISAKSENVEDIIIWISDRLFTLIQYHTNLLNCLMTYPHYSKGPLFKLINFPFNVLKDCLYWYSQKQKDIITSDIFLNICQDLVLSKDRSNYLEFDNNLPFKFNLGISPLIDDYTLDNKVENDYAMNYITVTKSAFPWDIPSIDALVAILNFHNTRKSSLEFSIKMYKVCGFLK